MTSPEGPKEARGPGTLEYRFDALCKALATRFSVTENLFAAKPREIDILEAIDLWCASPAPAALVEAHCPKCGKAWNSCPTEDYPDQMVHQCSPVALVEAPEVGYTADLIRALGHLAFEYRLNQNVANTLRQAADEIKRLAGASAAARVTRWQPPDRADLISMAASVAREARRHLDNGHKHHANILQMASAVLLNLSDSALFAAGQAATPNTLLKDDTP
jgi:hypothetical protein